MSELHVTAAKTVICNQRRTAREGVSEKGREGEGIK